MAWHADWPLPRPMSEPNGVSARHPNRQAGLNPPSTKPTPGEARRSVGGARLANMPATKRTNRRTRACFFRLPARSVSTRLGIASSSRMRVPGSPLPHPGPLKPPSRSHYCPLASTLSLSLSHNLHGECIDPSLCDTSCKETDKAHTHITNNFSCRPP